jgi:CCR4-NOT transcription complex subunit 6
LKSDADFLATGPPDPMDRGWHVLDDSPVSEKDKFSVLTFNILCDKAATQNQFGYAPASTLHWEVRKKMILEEIAGRNAEVVCLQEIDQENYHNYFREALAHHDYKGVFWPRSRSKTMSETQQKTVDGCAVFFKNSR